MPVKRVPVYRRTLYLSVHARQLAESVRLGKTAIALHMEGSTHPELHGCEVSTIIAGVVRDRKTLKKLQYDGPY